ncbi:hypothetical protein CBOM_03686 [Ceraceosorus bombacis]|uniref:Uncharacterized protein n=1 Tax=Ceraceosorus bombacis TaxID=401625 RepID=A0A0P1BHT5_9BASI|nr:hypothetical protein CBOM_03686 [Ceraceosorus bombacis]
MQKATQGALGGAQQERWDDEDFDLSDFSGPSSFGPSALTRSVLSHQSAESFAASGNLSKDVASDSHADDDEEENWDLPANASTSEKGPVVAQLSDADDDQTDTIKLSALAGNTLAQLAAASAASRSSGIRSAASPITYAGSVTHLRGIGSRSGSGRVLRMDAAGGGDWEDDLELPDLLPSQPRLRKTSSSAVSGDADFDARSGGETSDATSNSSSFLPRSVGGDLHSSHGRFPGSTSSSAASSLLSPPRHSSKPFADHALRGETQQRLDAKPITIPADFDDFENDFNLSPQLDRLHLSPALTKPDGNVSTQKASALWDDHPHSISVGSSANVEQTDHTSSQHSPTRTLRSEGPSAKVTPDSDADDEGEDLLEGLEVPAGLFDTDTAAQRQGKQRQSVGTVLSANERLRAVLHARECGLSASASGAFGPPSPFSPTESERDFASGLVISDDMDLSSGRLQAKSLSYGTRMVQRLPSGTRGVVYVPAAPHRSESEPRPSSSAAAHRVVASRHSSDHASGAVPQVKALPRVSALPAALPSHVGRGTSSTSKSSPPRASSAYSHATGKGPSQTVLRPSNLSLAPKKSAVELRGAPGSGSARPLTHGLRPPPAALNLMSRNVGEFGPKRSSQLSQKRSLPHMRHQSRTQSADSSSPTRSNHERSPGPPTPAVSSRSAAPTERPALATAALSTTSDSLPPARPSTPSYFLPTKASASRFAASTSAPRTRQGTSEISLAGSSTSQGSLPTSEAPSPWDAAVTLAHRSPGNLAHGSSSSAPAPLREASTKRSSKVRMLRRPARLRAYTGDELDAFDDLPTNPEDENRYLRPRAVGPAGPHPGDFTANLGLPDPAAAARPRRISSASNASSTGARDATLKAKTTADLISDLARQWSEKQPSAARQRYSIPHQGGIVMGGPNAPLNHERPLGARATRRRSRTSQSPTLIRNLGGASWSPRVIGNMRWNSIKRCWEGNENMLRDFENALSSSTRPALITQMPASYQTAGAGASRLCSPTIASPSFQSAHAIAAASTSGLLPGHGHAKATNKDCPQVVGSMVFDAQSMKWVPADGVEEPDPFANLEDDSTEDIDLVSEPGTADVAIKLAGISPALPRHVVEEAMGGQLGARIPGSSSSEAGVARRMRSSDLLLPLADTLSQTGVHEAIQRARAVSASRATQRSRKETYSNIARAIQRGDPCPPKDMQTYVHTELWRESIDAEKRHRAEVRCFYPSASAPVSTLSSTNTRSGTSRGVVGRSAAQSARTNREDLYLLQRLARQANAPNAPTSQTRS